MGIKLNSAKLLFEAHKAGVRFDKTVTLGRQFFTGSPQIFDKMKSLYGFGDNGFRLPETYGLMPPFAEPLFEMLGAKQVDAIDASDYEGTVIFADLNDSVPSILVQQYDCVFDTGTLEHVFNFPQSIKNCMDMTKVGGHLVLQFPTDNFCGHGFYQFSPELFFRVLSKQNGFEFQRMFVYEDIETPKYFEVTDPAKISLKQRMKTGKPISGFPTLGFLIARKTAHVEKLTTPQQSSYQASWDSEMFVPVAKAAFSKKRSATAKIRGSLRRMLPGLANTVSTIQRRRRFERNRLLGSIGTRFVGDLFSDLN